MPYSKKLKVIAMIDGEKKQYDMCSSDRHGFANCNLDLIYLGTGYIYSCDGVIQGGDKFPHGHFWIKAENCKENKPSDNYFKQCLDIADKTMKKQDDTITLLREEIQHLKNIINDCT